MTFLPIVDRELRVAARRRSTHLTRLGIVSAAMLFGGFFGFVMHRSSARPYEMGLTLFYTLSILSFIYSFCVGILATSDSLSVEKREGTLGLLFLTDLRGYDVVFGKLVASSLNAFYGMVGIFPILAIPLLLGGVTLSQFWQVAVVCLNLMFFSLATGIFASAISHEDRKAMGATILILIGISALPPLLGLYSYARSSWNVYPTSFLVPSPAVDCFLPFAPVFMAGKVFWSKLLLTHGYAWGLLIVSCFIVPRSWHENTNANKKTVWAGFKSFIAGGNSDKRTGERAQQLDNNAFMWLAIRHGGIRAMWILLGLIAVVWLWCWGTFGKDWLNKFNYVCTALILHAILKYFMASESSRRFLEDRRTGALELLLSTPMTVREILSGERMALFRLFSAPVLAVIVVDFVFLILGYREVRAYSSNDDAFWAFICLVGIAVLVIDMFALANIGMWLGMRSRGANRAASGALARVAILRWIIFFFSMFFLERLLFRNGNSEYWVTSYWFCLALGFDIAFAIVARTKISSLFRDIATQRFDGKKWFRRKQKLPPVIPAAQ